VHDESSSSASAKQEFSFGKTEWASPGILKVSPEDGPSFFVRDVYLPFPPERLFLPEVVLSSDEFEDLLHSARIWLAEKAAMAYLSRAEQCRRQLEIKLARKGFSDAETAVALDYLEDKKYLDDKRFCEAWIRNRLIHKAESAVKLQAGLQQRGIASDVARQAVLSAISADTEEELCKKAAERLNRRGKTGIKLVSALYRVGFSLKVIAKCTKSGENDE
jgi:regulatory protein